MIEGLGFDFYEHVRLSGQHRTAAIAGPGIDNDELRARDEALAADGLNDRFQSCPAIPRRDDDRNERLAHDARLSGPSDIISDRYLRSHSAASSSMDMKAVGRARNAVSRERSFDRLLRIAASADGDSGG